jgi:hypothetical protein
VYGEDSAGEDGEDELHVVDSLPDAQRRA